MQSRPFEQIRRLVILGKLDEAFKRLLEMKPDKSIKREINSLQTRFNNLERERRMNSSSDWEIRWNKLNNHILALIDQFEQETKEGDIRETHPGRLFFVLLLFTITTTSLFWLHSSDILFSGKHVNNSEKEPERTARIENDTIKNPNEKPKKEKGEGTVKIPKLVNDQLNYSDSIGAGINDVHPIIIRYNRSWTYRVFINDALVQTRDTLFTNKTHGVIVDSWYRRANGINYVKILDHYGQTKCLDSFPSGYLPYQEIMPCF